MKTRKQNTQLVQTRVSKETERRLIRKAETWGLSVAGYYLRMIILRDTARQWEE